MITTVIFDMGGVLIDLDLHALVEAFMKIAAPSMKAMSAQDMLGNGGDSPLNAYEKGLISTEEYLDATLRDCREGVTREEVANATFAILKTIPQPRLDAIRKLREKGYTVYLLSNIQDLHWTRINEMMGGWEQYFDKVFLSHEMHMVKPDDRIYEAVAEATALVPADTLYIDDVEANVEGGRRAGWQAIQATGDEWLPIIRQLPQL